MNRFFLFTVLAILIAVVTGQDSPQIEDSTKTYYKPFKCPCKCFTGHKVYKAARQCKKKKFLYRCAVSGCKKGYYSGQWCCDKSKPTAKPTPPPTTKPPTTKPPTTKPACPCYCTSRSDAWNACYSKPYCKVTSCGYYKYKCCHH